LIHPGLGPAAIAGHGAADEDAVEHGEEVLRMSETEVSIVC
jgi:hypothetical protein